MKNRSYFVMIAYNKHRFIVRDEIPTAADALDIATMNLKIRTPPAHRPGPRPKAIIAQVKTVCSL